MDGVHNDIIPSLLETVSASILISSRFGVVGGIVSAGLAAHLLVLLAASPRMITTQNEYMKQMYGAMDDAINQVGQYTNVNIFNAAKTQLNKLAALLNEFGKASDRSILIKSRVQLLSTAVHVLSLLGVGLFSIYKNDQLSSNDMLWVFIYLRQIAPSFEKLSQAINELLAEREFFKSTVEYIKDGYDHLDTGKPALIVTEKTASIQFKDVTLYYEGLKFPAVKQLSFDIEPGGFVVITGTSGAGKTSILSMLEKFYKPNEGEILIPNSNIANVSTGSVRDAFAVVPQDSLLMNVSLKQNIAFANPQATEEEIVKAIHFTGLGDVLRKHKNNPLGVGGSKLSGGQRQRVAIARAYVRNTQYLFLDEPTAALDPQTEEAIFLQLADLISEKKCTTVLVTHRLAALKKLPQITKIIVLHESEIVEQGTMTQLMQISDGYFANQMQVALAQEKLATVTRVRSRSIDEISFGGDVSIQETEMHVPEHIALNMGDDTGLLDGSSRPLLAKEPEKKSRFCTLL